MLFYDLSLFFSRFDRVSRWLHPLNVVFCFVWFVLHRTTRVFFSFCSFWTTIVLCSLSLLYPRQFVLVSHCPQQLNCVHCVFGSFFATQILVAFVLTFVESVRQDRTSLTVQHHFNFSRHFRVISPMTSPTEFWFCIFFVSLFVSLFRKLRSRRVFFSLIYHMQSLTVFVLVLVEGYNFPIID